MQSSGRHSPRTVSGFASAVLIAAAILVSYSSIAAAGPGPAQGPEAASADGGQHPASFMASHLATQEDIDALEARFGVRQASETYDVLTVDGFATGLAPHTHEEWQSLVGELVMYDAEPMPMDLPGSYDLSVNPEFPAVGNQASQGSCSAWAGTYYSYGYLEAVDNGWIDASTGASDQLLSPAWTYNMVNGGRDQGSWIDTNMMVIRDWGVATMVTMPYDDGDATSWGSPDAFREAPLHRGSEVGYLYYNPSTTVDAIKALVAAGTPVAFAMDANEYTGGFSDGNYIISSSEYASTSLNHAQTIVGYDDSLSDDSDTGAFRVVNSWGDGWGDSGYYWFTYAALEELGSLEVLYLNFMVDIPAYEPALLGVWHFDTAPSRNATLSVSVGSSPGTDDTKAPYYDGGLFSTSQVFPGFMVLDMTEFAGTFWSEGGMHLTVGDARNDGTVSSFRVEGYDAPFQPGRASQLSGQSPDVPEDSPATVSAYLDHYDMIAIDDALECTTLEWSTYGQAAWVGVDHHSSADGDSMQTGDISDLGLSRLDAQVEGPAEVTFDWMVSSQSGADELRFYIDEAVRDEVSGDVGWETVSAFLGEGSHTLSWVFAKDGSLSASDDSGWLDAVVVSWDSPEPNQVPEVVAVTASPAAYYHLPGSTVTFQVQVEDVEGGSISVTSSYGDGSPGDVSTLEAVSAGETVSFWFNHTYADGSDEPFATVFTAMDGDEHDPLDWDEMLLDVIVNSPPVAAVSSDLSSAGTGQLVTFDASGSSDPETAHALLQYRWDWTGDGVWDTAWSSSPEATHSFDLPGEYDVAVEVSDGIGLADSASVTVTVTGEAIPEFSVLVVPVFGMLMAVLVLVRSRRRGDA